VEAEAVVAERRTGANERTAHQQQQQAHQQQQQAHRAIIGTAVMGRGYCQVREPAVGCVAQSLWSSAWDGTGTSCWGGGCGGGNRQPATARKDSDSNSNKFKADGDVVPGWRCGSMVGDRIARSNKELLPKGYCRFRLLWLEPLSSRQGICISRQGICIRGVGGQNRPVGVECVVVVWIRHKAGSKQANQTWPRAEQLDSKDGFQKRMTWRGWDAAWGWEAAWCALGIMKS
jgi:hypothetical protein